MTTDWEQRARFYEQDAATAWEKCEERRLQSEELLAALKDAANRLRGAGMLSSADEILAAISKAEAQL